MSDNSHSGNPHTRLAPAPHLNASQRGLLASKLQNQHDEIMQQLNALDQHTRTADGDGAHEVDAKLSEIEQLELNDISSSVQLRNVAGEYSGK